MGGDFSTYKLAGRGAAQTLAQRSGAKLEGHVEARGRGPEVHIDEPPAVSEIFTEAFFFFYMP